jgi:peptide/nickel transport system ATP-binding protein
VTEPPLLAVSGLDVVYHLEEGASTALQDIELRVRPGEILGVVGESGSGKSTLSAALLRLLPANAEVQGGKVLLKGRNLLVLGTEELRRARGRDLVMIFQDPMLSLNPTFPIGSQMVEVLRSHLEGRCPSNAELRARAIEALTAVGIPDAADRFANYPHEFSGGMRQRIIIAMALLLKPAMLIADEPTSALDVTLEAQILELLRQLREREGTAILLVSHDLGVIAQLCDRVVVMYAGRVVEENDTVGLFDHPKHPYTRALIECLPSRLRRGGTLATIPGRVPSLSALPAGCKFADRCPYVQGLCRQEEPRLIPQDPGGVRCHMHDPAKCEAWRSGPAPQPVGQAETTLSTPIEGAAAGRPSAADAHLEIRNLRKYFDERRTIVGRLFAVEHAPVRAIDGVSLTLRRGEILGLVGESGSGKTTLGEVILRLQPVTSGEVRFAGENLRGMSRRDIRGFRRRAQMIFQESQASLSPRQRVASLVTEPYRINRVPPAERYSVGELLAMVGLSADLATKYPHQLSGGQARRVGIARALSLRPEFVVADEPTAGLDVSAAAAILNLIRDLQQRLGLTFLIITHNVNLIAYMAHRIAVMYLGSLVEVGPTEAVFDSPAHPYSLGLLSLTPQPDPRERRKHRLLVPGEIPSPKHPPPGCRFHTRCRFAEAKCRSETPALEAIGGGHEVACHFWQRVSKGAS